MKDAKISQLNKQRMALFITLIISGVLLIVLIAVVIYLGLAIKAVDEQNKTLVLENLDFHTKQETL